MDYKKLVDLNQQFANVWKTGANVVFVGGYKPDSFLEMNATAITDLLARAEAAEDALGIFQSFMMKYKDRAEKAERERDVAVSLCGKLIALCSPPKEWEPKLFRRHINRPGDYMGCGYDFLDSFNRIFDNFEETADDELYAAIREAAEKEILERVRNMIGQKEE